MKIIIDSIDCRYVMPAKDYEWLISHLGEELQVASIAFNQRGGIFCIAVATECEDGVAVIFEDNHAKFRFIGTEELSCIDTI